MKVSTCCAADLTRMAKMADFAMAALVASVALLALVPAPTHAYDGTFVFWACNTQKTTKGTSTYKAITAVISDLEQQTPYYSYDYKNKEKNDGVTVYGRGTCRYGLSDCTACLQNVGTLILSTCEDAVGARYQVTDCFMEYENYAF